MGKNSKKKRQRVSYSHSKCIVKENSEESDSSDADLDETDNTSMVPTTNDIDAAIRFFNALGRNIDIFKSKSMKSLRTHIFPLLNLQKSAFFEPEENSCSQSDDTMMLADPALQRCVFKVGSYLLDSCGQKEFLLPSFKPFRKALYPLVISAFNLKPQSQLEDKSFSARISTALRNRHWTKALMLLYDMATDGEPPKLGSLQRWVRDCDLAPTVMSEDDTNAQPMSTPVGNSIPASHDMSLLLLDAVMRVFNKNQTCASSSSTSSSSNSSSNSSSSNSKYNDMDRKPMMPPAVTAPSLPTTATLRRNPPLRVRDHTLFQETSNAEQLGTPRSLSARDEVLSAVSVVSHVPGPLRRPPNKYDLNVVTTKSKLIDLSFYVSGKEEKSRDTSCSSANNHPDPDVDPANVPSCLKPGYEFDVSRIDVPHVPGAFVLTNVFSAWACKQIIHLAESIGYVPDAVEGIDNVIWLADDELLSHAFDRCKALLPTHMGKCELRGINATWRLFRYFPGSVYHPHIDGAWPGSGIRQDTGEYAQDAFDGDRFSKLTFLVYLNEGFLGGETAFFLPSHERGVGHIDTWSVRPTVGSVLCFPHGDAMGSLVHEGSEVVAGGEQPAKYVIRTDVLYSVGR